MKMLKKITKADALFLLIAGLIMGTVFTFGTQYWNESIKYDEAQQVNAIFSSYKENKRRSHVKQIILRFDDYEQLYIDGVCINNELCDLISEIPSGTTLEMMVHPNSNKILEMETGSTKILEFYDSMQKLSSEASGFMYLGIFCYILSLMGAGYFIFPK